MCLFSCGSCQRLSAKTLLVRAYAQVITSSGKYWLYMYGRVFSVMYSVRSPFISGGVCVMLLPPLDFVSLAVFLN